MVHDSALPFVCHPSARSRGGEGTARTSRCIVATQRWHSASPPEAPFVEPAHQGVGPTSRVSGPRRPEADVRHPRGAGGLLSRLLGGALYSGAPRGWGARRPPFRVGLIGWGERARSGVAAHGGEARRRGTEADLRLRRAQRLW